MQTAALSTYDHIFIDGEKKGKLEGKIESETRIITQVLIRFPNWNDGQIAEFLQVEIELVERVRQKLDERSK